MLRIAFVLCFFIGMTRVTNGQEVPSRHQYTTRKMMATETPPVIDGTFNEPVWETVPWARDFTQHEPHEGIAPSQNSAFKILFDENNIYVAMKAFDTAPDSIETRLNRRDNMDGDLMGVQFDSYYDKLTAFSFLVSAGGVKLDFLMSNDGENEDESWDPIWYVKTKVDADGWNAEMKIPLSQLRFDRDSSSIWGMQAARFIYRLQEVSLWQPIARDAPGWVHLFGELNGMGGIKPKRQIEIAPYGVLGYDTYQAEDGNPFQDGKDLNYKIGLDGKVGITNNMILDFTVNPDFGQVEADPSEVNLTAFESYFEEKRPFFIEGKSLFSYAIVDVGDSDMSAEGLFYSRRIGRRPQGDPDLLDDEYANLPEFTNILGAAKVTGKTKKGLSFGILESVTAEEKTEIDYEGDRRHETVEPLTNYLVGRLQQDFGKGKTILGGIVTHTKRFINDSNLNFLHTEATTGGINFTTTWKDKNYYFSLNNVFSHVKGSEEALINTQESSARYFQRPDAKHLELDSSRTSLSGYGGRLSIGKQGGGHFNYGAILTWKSPGLETNDVGFLRSTDEILQILYAGYRIWEPFSIFRNLNFNAAQWHAWDFGGVNIVTGGNLNVGMQFKNYFRFETGFNLEGNALSSNMLRGGPMFKSPGSSNHFFFVSTDDRKKLVFEIMGSNGWGWDKSSRRQNYALEINYRPTNTLQFSLDPSISMSRRELQYIDESSFNGDPRYLFGHIEQNVVSFDFRINLSITPDLSIQYWGQPFIASGGYSNFKRITQPQAKQFHDRFQTYTSDQITYIDDDEVYFIDENLDGSFDYAFDKPDFNFKEFLSNLVMRWEYIPGSTLYVVWSQSRHGVDPDGRFFLNRDFQDMFRIVPHNVFLIKLSFRFRA